MISLSEIRNSTVKMALANIVNGNDSKNQKINNG